MSVFAHSAPALRSKALDLCQHWFGQWSGNRIYGEALSAIAVGAAVVHEPPPVPDADAWTMICSRVARSLEGNWRRYPDRRVEAARLALELEAAETEGSGVAVAWLAWWLKERSVP